jgi:two-component system chemotaxis sensor kinase CheA
MGNVYLDAYHQGDSIVIGIRDDGRGLDREKLLAKGIERGLVTPDEQLSDQQVFALIMQAGFSTAEQITDISGRGVGMDVVKRNIEALRGKIEIISEKGTGTTINVRIPLTLAIIDGMLVRVGTERLIIPTILIEQSLRPQPEQITTVQRRGEMLRVRGELCPLVQLGQLFGYSERCDPAETLVVIAHSEGVKIGLVVDELIGQQQVVVKSLSEGFKRVRGVSGAAILGDGRVGLILEPTGLLELHKTRRNNTEVCRRRGEAEVTPSAGTVADQPAEAPYEPEAVEETTGDAETSEHEQTPEVPALT